MRYIFRRAVASRYVLVTVRGERARVVHFTFHILRRTAGGRRLGNVAEGPHSFRIKQRRRRRRRRRSSSSSRSRRRCRRRSDARAPQRPQNTLCPGRNISPPSPPPSPRSPPPQPVTYQSPSITRPPSGGTRRRHGEPAPVGRRVG